ncbi:hypothetical protein T484DRAFT_1657898, partial [Baffinella frigidus]
RRLEAPGGDRSGGEVLSDKCVASREAAVWAIVAVAETGDRSILVRVKTALEVWLRCVSRRCRLSSRHSTDVRAGARRPRRPSAPRSAPPRPSRPGAGRGKISDGHGGPRGPRVRPGEAPPRPGPRGGRRCPGRRARALSRGGTRGRARRCQWRPGGGAQHLLHPRTGLRGGGRSGQTAGHACQLLGRCLSPDRPAATLRSPPDPHVAQGDGRGARPPGPQDRGEGEG